MRGEMKLLNDFEIGVLLREIGGSTHYELDFEFTGNYKLGNWYCWVEIRRDVTVQVPEYQSEAVEVKLPSRWFGLIPAKVSYELVDTTVLHNVVQLQTSWHNADDFTIEEFRKFNVTKTTATSAPSGS